MSKRDWILVCRNTLILESGVANIRIASAEFTIIQSEPASHFTRVSFIYTECFNQEILRYRDNLERAISMSSSRCAPPMYCPYRRLSLQVIALQSAAGNRISLADVLHTSLEATELYCVLRLAMNSPLHFHSHRQNNDKPSPEASRLRIWNDSTVLLGVWKHILIKEGLRAYATCGYGPYDRDRPTIWMRTPLQNVW